MVQEIKGVPETPRVERPETGPRPEAHPLERKDRVRPAEQTGEGPGGFVVPQEPETPQTALPAVKSPELQKVESVLEEDLEEMYRGLSRDKQIAFKKKGEEVSRKIMTVLGRAHAHAKDILKLIRDWLRMIPGVNKFFLEQESKIKTDKIVAIGEKKQ